MWGSGMKHTVQLIWKGLDENNSWWFTFLLHEYHWVKVVLCYWNCFFSILLLKEIREFPLFVVHFRKCLISSNTCPIIDEDWKSKTVKGDHRKPIFSKMHIFKVRNKEKIVQHFILEITCSKNVWFHTNFEKRNGTTKKLCKQWCCKRKQCFLYWKCISEANPTKEIHSRKI